MRAILPIVLVLLAPTAAAQGSLLVDLANGSAPVTPLSATMSLPYSVLVDCEAATTNLTVTLSLPDTPAWASATPVPRDHAVEEACEGAVNLTGAVVVTVTENAPAFQKTALRLVAQASTANGTLFGSDTGVIEPGFFGIIEVDADETTKTVTPGSIVAFPVRIQNLGNGPIRVAVEAIEVGDGMTFVAPPPLVILSLATGGASNEQTVPLHAQVAKGSLVTNRNDALTVQVRSYYWTDPALVGDEAKLSFVVRTQGSVPGAGVALVALAFVAAALAWRRRA